MKKHASILVADDDLALREMMSLTLKKEGHKVVSAQSAAEARDLIHERSFDLVVSDIYLGDGTGIDLLDDIQATDPDTAVILVTAQGTVETAAAAGAAGVFDYLAKPFQIEQLVERVRAALARGGTAPAERPPEGPETMIIGSHPSIVEVYKAVARVGPLAIPVLIQGETGTGKELVARALHTYGADADGPFVAINCGAIPETLLESELFGHRRGAFTGADRDHPGAIAAADGGTIFLDEVGELPTLLQVKLLRFLQEGEIRPLGTHEVVTPNARVIAATHRDLRREVAEGEFREDFFYRLATYEITIPPLRERPTDIELLVEHFRRGAEQRLGRTGLDGPSRATLDLLEAYSWPGNVRELEHLVQRVLIDAGSLADVEAVRPHLGAEPAAVEAVAPSPVIGQDLSLEEVERLHIAAVLARCEGNRTRTAEILGIERKSLYRKAKRLGIDLDVDGE